MEIVSNGSFKDMQMQIEEVILTPERSTTGYIFKVYGGTIA
jgi:hypothetical protein